MTFEKYIDVHFFQHDHYEKMKHQLLHIRGIMSRNKAFAKQPVNVQYDQCILIVTIALQSQTDLLNRTRIVRKKERKEYPYSIDHNFQPKQVIPIESCTANHLLK